jgi:hypothetical protein
VIEKTGGGLEMEEMEEMELPCSGSELGPWLEACEEGY